MTTYGLTTTGFTPMPFTEVRSEINASIQAKRGPSTDVSDGSFLGQLIGIFSEREASIWDLGQAVYNAFLAAAATGTALDNLSALTGTFRQAAFSSTVMETLTGTASTTVPQGSQVKTTSTGAVFASIAVCTIAATVNWTHPTAYVVGNRVNLGGNVYQCTIGGTSGGTGPSGTGQAIVDGTVTWKWIGAGVGAIDQTFASVTQDAIVALAGDLNVIQTPVGGWSSAINQLDASVGAPEQTDESLRTQRVTELAGEGSSPANALYAKLQQVSGVTSVTVYHNDGDSTDGNGLAPHSVLALVIGGADVDVATCLATNVAAGVGTNVAFAGATVIAVVDSEGISHNYGFLRPTAVPIYVSITVHYVSTGQTATTYPSDGDTEVKTAIVNFGNARGAGADAIASALGAQAFVVPGVWDVPRSGSLGGCLISSSPTPTSDATITIDAFHVATYDTSRVTVTSSLVTP